MYSRTVRTALIVIYVYIWCFKLWRMSGAGDGLSMSLDVSRYFSQAYSSTMLRPVPLNLLRFESCLS